MYSGFMSEKGPLSFLDGLNDGSIYNNIYSDSLSLWAREDSAYQRMVADMKKAGLNPWTGVSSGGSSTGNVNPSLSALSGSIAALGGVLDAAKTDNDTVKTINKTITALTNLFSSFPIF